VNQNCCFCSSLVCQRHMKMQFQLKTVPKISHNCPALLSQNLQAAATCFCTCNHEPHEFCCTFLSRLWSTWPLPRRPCKRRLPKNVWLQCAVAEWFKLGWHGKECKTSLKCCDFHQHQHQQITDVMDVHSQEKMSMFHQDSYVILQRRFFITWQSDMCCFLTEPRLNSMGALLASAHHRHSDKWIPCSCSFCCALFCYHIIFISNDGKLHQTCSQQNKPCLSNAHWTMLIQLWLVREMTWLLLLTPINVTNKGCWATLPIWSGLE